MPCWSGTHRWLCGGGHISTWRGRDHHYVPYQPISWQPADLHQGGRRRGGPHIAPGQLGHNGKGHLRRPIACYPLSTSWGTGDAYRIPGTRGTRTEFAAGNSGDADRIRRWELGGHVPEFPGRARKPPGSGLPRQQGGHRSRGRSRTRRARRRRRSQILSRPQDRCRDWAWPAQARTPSQACKVT